MPTGAAGTGADRSQRRASYQQARSHETKRALVQAAVALWRANGYTATTVADICRAAGVSKGLFYFYFPRKEDVLLEIGVLSTRGARRTAHELLRGPYDVTAVVAATLGGLERSMRRNPPELIIETILESYRHELRALAGEVPPEPAPLIFGDLFDRAVADGALPGHVDAARLARLAQSLVSEGARHWAAGAYAPRSFADVVTEDITALIAGFSQPPPPPA
ncbi:TetR/AcrR family transcriptional regulator [Parafrankia sp. BMG5.11]|uniref:TetR/AcrR family transcriptional regulator n=1 Tax=Parafrankia sp. BMG5.11 TaxID=222540 RepID=UPI00103CA6F0|nr:TetR/AcrR family transcriptional regulator [Parafrankia sp. BMG5.11]TCJ32538.1 TetR/AcrR family transcriptional regulator [Parafrankia sp. BMG5.11]